MVKAWHDTEAGMTITPPVIATRLTARLGITHPVLQAPMALAAGGALAAAVSNAGGMGLIGGGYGDYYGDPDWLDREIRAAGNAAVGCGFITWSLAEHPEMLALALSYAPRALMLSFGDMSGFAPAIHDANVTLITQVQSLADARHAVDCGAGVIVAQGSEAGGHGERRATMTLVPEIADYLVGAAPDTCLVAAGGIADGRGLAAALMLGADGVLVGTRFWASQEAVVHRNMLTAAIDASGDDTIRSTVMDIARARKWPSRFTARVLKNDFTDEYHGNEEALRAAGTSMRDAYGAAWSAGDTTLANVFVGEATGLVHDIPPAADILADMVTSAAGYLRGDGGWQITGDV